MMSGPHGRSAVAPGPSPSSSRQTKPGEASASALIGSISAMNPSISADSTDPRGRPRLS
jgi:hypothetical protein